MTWLFSRALMQSYENSRCSRALVAASLPATCLDGALSAPLSVMPTQHKFWRNDKTMEPSDLSRFGLTCAVLTADRGADLLTWCLEASRARTSVWPARAQALKAPAAECGTTWRASWAKFDPASSTWKTAQPSLLGDSDECSVTWPRSGMTAGGLCWELPMSAPPISATGSGLWLQTPIAAMAKNTMRSAEFAKGSAPSPQEFVRQWPTPRSCSAMAARITPEAAWSANRFPNLETMVGRRMWPTPTSSLGTNGGLVTPTKGREGGTLIEALSARTFAPPTARDWRSGKASQATHDRNSRPLSEQIGGLLNPEWVEWLMNWPIGWTDLKPLATDRCQPAPQPRGECSQAVEA